MGWIFNRVRARSGAPLRPVCLPSSLTFPFSSTLAPQAAQVDLNKHTHSLRSTRAVSLVSLSSPLFLIPCAAVHLGGPSLKRALAQIHHQTQMDHIYRYESHKNKKCLSVTFKYCLLSSVASTAYTSLCRGLKYLPK